MKPLLTTCRTRWPRSPGRWLGMMLAPALVSMATAAQAADTIDVLCLGPGRGYDNGEFFQIVMTGASMDTVRAALAADGFAFHPSEEFSADTLAGYRIVFLGLFDPSESLTVEERVAIKDYVLGGGALIYLGDNGAFSLANHSVAGPFGVQYGTTESEGYAKDVADPLHIVVNGAAGQVLQYDGSGNMPGFCGGITDTGTFAKVLLSASDMALVAVIDRDALAPGSGPAVFLGDANGFLDPDVGTVGQADNLTLIRNVFRFAAGDCTQDSDCDDGLFCNGVETCPNGACAAGEFPCSGQGCDEVTDSCGACNSDTDCDDGIFCNGQELCVGGTCELGIDRCDNACGQCDEASGTCVWCQYDLDKNTVIGTGDFSFLSACMGECYPSNHPCAIANFDGDLGGCVGSGDFAGFSGCFGLNCSECDGCFDTGSKVSDWLSRAVSAEIRLVATAAPTIADTVDALPTGQNAFRVGQRFYVEAWASLETPFSNGLASAYVDLSLDATSLTTEMIEPGARFAMFTKSTINTTQGRLGRVGGAAIPGDKSLGIETTWVRVALVQLRVERAGVTGITARPSPSPFGISVVGELGNLDASQIRYGELTLNLYEHSGAGALQDTASPASRPPE